jgi:hypothetical protein
MHASDNPFPSDEEVAFMAQLASQLFELEFRQPAGTPVPIRNGGFAVCSWASALQPHARPMAGPRKIAL